ncbi:hypothetical protein H7K24_17830 [Mycobacterium fragae]|uniref:DoxX family protein n=1 Tax=Mycobacterium fragae TaxID=1260918 RepID=A0A1X1UR82_9MYCO|nr:hypothetical protein [Mycobacterium fragae]MCV7402004.1 hypothetical protein [Mycobacterium fragae]ORV59188.1 hypothetical protein AWC06_17600 [Mycobacterium fragae]
MKYRTAIQWAVRVAISASLAVSGVIHADLYIDGYRNIPTVGAAFLFQASTFCALAVLILVGAPAWLSWIGAVLSVGTLIAFALSRTVGLFGFTESGWDPAPQAALSAITEGLTVVLVAAAVFLSAKQTNANAAQGSAK